MAVSALAPEALADLHTGSPDVFPTVLDDLSLTIARDCPSAGAAVSTSSGRWVGRLRRITGARLRLWGLEAFVDDTQLLVSELVTNGLRHGTCSQVVFRLVIGVDALMVEVDDGSPGPRAHTRQAGPDSENGRGLVLVSALATAWGVSDDGTRTWCVVRTETPAAT